MKTDDLIRLMAEDAPVRVRLSTVLALAIAAGVVCAGLILLVTIGIRPDLGAAVETVRVQFKLGFTLLMAAAGCAVLLVAGLPGRSAGRRLVVLGLPLALLVLGVVLERTVVPPGRWAASLEGQHAAFCVFFIPVLALVPFAVFFWALRDGAPENPGLAGASAGLAAGAIGAAVYAWHCPDDSPLFVATWYMLAMLLVTGIGYGLGRRTLRW